MSTVDVPKHLPDSFDPLPVDQFKIEFKPFFPHPRLLVDAFLRYSLLDCLSAIVVGAQDIDILAVVLSHFGNFTLVDALNICPKIPFKPLHEDTVARRQYVWQSPPV